MERMKPRASLNMCILYRFVQGRMVHVWVSGKTAWSCYKIQMGRIWAL